MKSLENFLDREKVADLREILKGYGSLLIAFSGGVDSSFLLKAAVDFLGPEGVLAVTSSGSIYPQEELADARQLATRLEAPWKLIERSPLEEKDFRANSPDRCYFCKLGLFHKLKEIAAEEGLGEVADGSIEDDLGDHRPGARAAEELGVKSPLREAGLTKEEIRKLGKEIGLPVWGKPSNACLATRIPYGEEVTEEKIRRIGEAEAGLRELGFEGFRVRHHGEIARIELPPKDLTRALEEREEIVDRLKELGYNYVALDLEGYRTGSLNEVV